jgi:UDP-glucose 4-epimerase
MSFTLVTGGAGYIGSQLVNTIYDRNPKAKVIVIDNLSTGRRKTVNSRAKFFKIDIRDDTLLHSFFSKYKFNSVFHFAANISVEDSEKNLQKYYLNNVVGTENLLKLCKIKKIKFFVFSSTSAVYGDVRGKVSEDSIKIPKNNYGRTKLFAEYLVKNYFRKSNINYAILRYFNVVGADVHLRSGQLCEGSLFKTISKNLINNDYSINIFGNDYKTKDGTCIRDYIDVNDLCEIHLRALSYLKNKKKNLVVNCGYGKGSSVKQIIKLFSNLVHKKILITNKAKRIGDVEKIYCDTKKLKKTFPDWIRKFSLKDSIKNSLDWERKLSR